MIRASKTAGELQTWSTRSRADVGAIDEALLVLDGLVMGAEAFLDPVDTRPWFGKIESVMEAFDDVGQVYGPRMVDFIIGLDEQGIERLVKKYGRKDYLAHIRRMVGEAAFNRLHVAVSQDIDIIASAVYLGVDALMPYAQAMDDMAGLLSPEQIREFMEFNPANGLMLEMVLGLLDFLDATIAKVMLPEHVVALGQVRDRTPSTRDVMALTARMRDRISAQSSELLQQVSGVLERKLRGAKDALVFSADSNSQAANSMVEFINRLLRAPFEENEVLEWVQQNYVDVPDLTYRDAAGKLRPTKRGQALCMLHACRPVEQASPIHLLAVTSLNATRRQLEKIKHADEGTDEEREQIETCLMAVEAFVQVGCRMAWAMLPDEALAELALRLDPKAQHEVVRAETA